MTSLSNDYCSTKVVPARIRSRKVPTVLVARVRTRLAAIGIRHERQRESGNTAFTIGLQHVNKFFSSQYTNACRELDVKPVHSKQQGIFSFSWPIPEPRGAVPTLPCYIFLQIARLPIKEAVIGDVLNDYWENQACVKEVMRAELDPYVVLICTVPPS